ncbi:MAG TPA: type 1 glutamine amidotransferase [Rhodothermales bacterium]|nr:type 1 glutamine amidotransferase [Rhodothermales bacterium]
MNARIGITTSFEEGEQRLNHAYVRAVEAAGGVPVIVPMLASDAAYATFVREIDGLVVTGGPAVTDGLIGELPADIAETDPVRREADERLLRVFLAEHKPVLGICYGMQLLNALAGGTLYADVQYQIEGGLVHSNKRGGEEHPVRIVSGSHLHTILQRSTVVVNTRHIQAVASPGEGFHVAATAPDGVIEAIESEGGIIIGVQFHPERMDALLPLFRDLVERSARHRMASETALEDVYGFSP